jgi:hypothetical protein
MCLNCGCGEAANDRGLRENLTIRDLRDAAAANGQTLRESAQHILDTAIAFEERPLGAIDTAAGGTGAHTRVRSGLGQPAGEEPPPPASPGTPDSES